MSSEVDWNQQTIKANNTAVTAGSSVYNANGESLKTVDTAVIWDQQTPDSATSWTPQS